MAFTKNVLPNTELKQMRDFYVKCDYVNKKWEKDWEWLVDEYKNLHDEMSRISDKMEIGDPSAKKLFHDKRTTKPIPNSTNHEYGWLAEKDEFRLEIYGPDYSRPELLSDYKINFDVGKL